MADPGEVPAELKASTPSLIVHFKPVSVEVVDQLSIRFPDEKSSKISACARPLMSNPSATMTVLVAFFISFARSLLLAEGP